MEQITDEVFLANKVRILNILGSIADMDNWTGDGRWVRKRHPLHWVEELLDDLEGQSVDEVGIPVENE